MVNIISMYRIILNVIVIVNVVTLFIIKAIITFNTILIILVLREVRFEKPTF